MTSIDDRQQTLSPLFADSTPPQHTRSVESHANVFSQEALESKNQQDVLHLTPKAQKELQDAREREHAVHNQEDSRKASQSLSTDTVRSDTGHIASKENLSNKEAEQQNALNEQDSEIFVRYATINESSSYDQQGKTQTISWDRGTYFVGRRPNGHQFTMAHGTENVSPLPYSSSSNQMTHASKTYAIMARQGVMPTALAPNGTGISLLI